MARIKALSLFTVILASCCLCAQDYPRFELSAGYSYGSVDTQGYSTQRDAQGWTGSLTTNLKKWAGLETEVSGRYNNLSFVSQGNTLTYNSNYYSFLAGPRFAYRKGKVTPFVHGLFGVERAPAYSSTTYDPATSIATTPYDTGFASAAGGGVDYAVSRRVSLRTQADYFFTRYATTLTPTSNNFRVLAAVVFNFGGTESFSAKHSTPPSLSPIPISPDQGPVPLPTPPRPAVTVEPAVVADANVAVEDKLDPIPVLDPPVEVEPALLTRTTNSSFRANVPKPPIGKIPALVAKTPEPVTAKTQPVQIQPAPIAQSTPEPQPATATLGLSQNTVVISSAAQLQAASQQRQEESLGDVARRYRNKKLGNNGVPQTGF